MMSEEYVLEATRREVVGKKVKLLRREGKLPAVVYGHGVEPTPIVLELHETAKLLRDIGSSTLVTLKVDAEEYSVLVRDYQKGILSRKYTHLDFLALDMEQTVRTQVAVVVLDVEVPAVKEFEAMLSLGFDSLEVEALPKDLPEYIEVDPSVLLKIGDSITVSDIVPPQGVEFLDDPTTMIAFATPPSALEEEEEEEVEDLLEEELVAGEPEVIEKGKAEEDEEA